LFLTIMLSLIFPPSSVLKIIIIHYFSNIIIGFLVRSHAPNITSSNLDTTSKVNISSVLIKSINRSMSTLLMILGTIVFYMLLSYIITNLLSTTPFIKLIISSVLEITNGLNFLAKTSYLLKIKEIIALATISFGGLSIHTQIKSILEDTNISYKPFLKGRLLQVLIGTILIIFI
ncbi:MAG: hypothetical protein K2J20_00425, partial [Bacilli bacterium]|nr:hypothetical protein [Bacilli bacterium]